MKTVIPLEKKHVFHHENIAYQKDAIPDRTLSLHYVSAVLPIVRDGHLKRNTLANIESPFARLKTEFRMLIKKQDKPEETVKKKKEKRRW